MFPSSVFFLFLFVCLFVSLPWSTNISQSHTNVLALCAEIHLIFWIVVLCLCNVSCRCGLVSFGNNLLTTKIAAHVVPCTSWQLNVVCNWTLALIHNVLMKLRLCWRPEYNLLNGPETHHLRSLWCYTFQRWPKPSWFVDADELSEDCRLLRSTWYVTAANVWSRRAPALLIPPSSIQYSASLWCAKAVKDEPSWVTLDLASSKSLREVDSRGNGTKEYSA